MAETSPMEDLLYLMARLRDPAGGCPWDRSQDYRSLVAHTLEECYELVDTIERGDWAHLGEELGDVLFQVVFYSRLAEEEGHFDFAEVAAQLVEKLVRRHPHVFTGGSLRGGAEGAGAAQDPAAIRGRWEEIKREERQRKSLQGALADVPLALPALTRARKLQARAARAGFDWRQGPGLLDAVGAKLAEEFAELREAAAAGDRAAMEGELGDLLFSVVNLARHMDIDPETALRRSNRKFERRFNAMEGHLAAAGSAFEEVDEDGIEALWQRVKRELRPED